MDPLADNGFQIQREVYLKATLPNSRKAQLMNGTLSVYTRSGEELSFTEADVKAMQTMFDEVRKG